MMSGWRARFDDLYVRWRFGDLAAGREAVRQGLALLQTAASDGERAALHLRIGLLLRGDDPEGAEVHLGRARDLGAAIPRAVARADESGAPETDPKIAQPQPALRVERAIVQPASTRRFRPPSGDPWHPSFDLAATTLAPLTLSVIADGTLSIDTTGERPLVYVFDAAERLVRALSSGPAPFIVPPQDDAGPVVLLDDAFDGFNVCHALFDKFPRLAVYERRFPGRRLRGLMVRDAPYYYEALASFGHDLVTPSAARWSIRAPELALLSNHRRGEVMHPGYSAADWALGFLRQRCQAPVPGGRRLYVSREDAAVRRLVNEAEVRARFVAHGFEIHLLTGLGFEDQKALFQAASHIAGVHGAGLANLAFAHPSARVLEIMPPLAGTFAYWVMARGLGQGYQLLTAGDAELTVGPAASYDPLLGDRAIRVDLDRLDAALTLFTA